MNLINSEVTFFQVIERLLLLCLRLTICVIEGEENKMEHNELTFTAEYCRARRIPYRIKREGLFIEGQQVCFSLYNLTYVDIIQMIDKLVHYDEITTFYKNL